MTRPTILDLFCGAGGAAEGYHRAGFDVVGVDIKPQPHYPFQFYLADALALEADGRLTLGDFQAIHASPPCQFGTRARNVGTKKTAVPLNLIPQTRELLLASGLPYVIENVENVRGHLINPAKVCGSSFGLKVRRHRLFESSVPLTELPCDHKAQGKPVGVYHAMNDQVQGTDSKTGRYVLGGRTAATLEEGQQAMGIDWMTWPELREAIPPAYTEFIGGQILRAV